jgi:fatty-acyl-CoA synthase
MPKAVVYSHRSTYLHTLGTLATSGLGVQESDRILPVVPMFHANAWGLAHAAVASGASLIMPGPDLSAPAIAALIEDERVTIAAGVPTIWMGVLPELKGRDTSALRAIPCGGSAVPRALSEGYRAQTGLPIMQAWGMTETSPVATSAMPPVGVDPDSDEGWRYRASQGRPLAGVTARIVGDSGEELPRDGVAVGEVEVRGPWVTARYYNDDDDADSQGKFRDGWLRTGDVGTLDRLGFITLTDRAKDVIKSGGEWISSVELEGTLMAHPAIREAVVVGVPDERWDERPLAAIVVKEGESVTPEELCAWLTDRVAKWWVPERWAVIDEVPKTSVGKFDKKVLRKAYADGSLDVTTLSSG